MVVMVAAQAKSISQRLVLFIASVWCALGKFCTRYGLVWLKILAVCLLIAGRHTLCQKRLHFGRQGAEAVFGGVPIDATVGY